jgi:hypothetical protein
VAEVEANIRPAPPPGGVVKPGQRNGRHAHLGGVTGGEKAQRQNLKSAGGGHSIELFIDGADQNLPPEPLDHALRLVLFAQPVQHADAVQIGSAAVLGLQCKYCPDKGQLLPCSQKFQAEKGLGEMSRPRQEPCAESGSTAATLNPVELAVELERMGDTQPAVEVEEIYAAPQQDVLAVVDDFVGAVGLRNGVRGRPSAWIGSRLIDIDVKPGIRQGGSRGETSQPGAGH